MSELTDLEIAKLIHEITGRDKVHETDIEWDESYLYIDTDGDDNYSYRNPLVDNGWCFLLVSMFSVKIDHFDECVYVTAPRRVFISRFTLGDIASLRKAICLAIIESQTLNKE